MPARSKKKMTVKIYKKTITKAYVASMELGTFFSLSPWGNDTDHYEGYDDGGKLYELPEGFKVAESNGGTLEIYDAKGTHYELTSNQRRTSPQIVSSEKIITLKAAA